MKLPFANFFGNNLKVIKPEVGNKSIVRDAYQELVTSLNKQMGSITADGKKFQPKYRRFYCRLCLAGGLGQGWFVLSLGMIGALVTICDIMQITEGGSMLTESIWRNRINRGTQRLVSPETERDMKLMVSILSMEHYILMVFGVSQENPALLLPWLMMEALVITLEAVLFGMRLFVDGFAMRRGEVLMSAIVIHNWFQVFCFFRKNLSFCDL